MKACSVLQGCLWARIKDVSNRITSIVRLLYRFGPSLTTGVVEVGFTTQRTIMTDRRQPCEQRSSCDCEGNMSASAWLSTFTAGDIDVGLHVCDSYPGGAHPGDYNQYPIATLLYCVCVVWRQCHVKCN